MSRRFARVATASALLSLAAPPVAQAGGDPPVPVPDISVDRDHVVWKARAGDTVRATFQVNNRASCSVDLTQGRTSLRGITVDCRSWRLAGHESTTCEVTATLDRPGTLHDRFILVARVGDDCKRVPLARVAERERLELRPLLDEEARLQRTRPDPANAKARDQMLVDQYNTADTALRREEEQLEVDIRAEVAALDQAWNEYFRQHLESLENRRGQLSLASTDDTALRALDDALGDLRLRAQHDIDTKHAKRLATCDIVRQLQREKDLVLAELRRGEWHDKCRRTASQIEKEDHESLYAHLRREGGGMVPVPRKVIDDKAAEYDLKIEKARSACTADTHTETEAIRYWPEQVRALEAKRPELQRARQATIDRLRAELAALEESARNNTVRQRERVDATRRSQEARREQMRERRDQLARKLAADRKAVETELERAREQAAEQLRKVTERIGRLRVELAALQNQIINAHQQATHTGVLIDATFQR